VSYTINYMEKNTIRGAGQHSSQHGESERIGAHSHSDSDSDDQSLMAEKEDSHSSIDTIEEEVDLSSEGSDHDDQQEHEAALGKKQSEGLLQRQPLSQNDVAAQP